MAMDTGQAHGERTLRRLLLGLPLAERVDLEKT
jgi:hypothetical protein